VAPVDVEEVLLSHPHVQQAIVVGLPDKDREEIIAALVVLKSGKALDSKELLAFCKINAAAFKIPRFIAFATDNEVPLTDTGKVHRIKTQLLLEEKQKFLTNA